MDGVKCMNGLGFGQTFVGISEPLRDLSNLQ